MVMAVVRVIIAVDLRGGGDSDGDVNGERVMMW